MYKNMEYYNEIVQNLDKPDKLSELLSVDIDRVDNRGDTALHVAACSNNGVVIKHLLRNRAAINKKNIMGWTALHETAFYNNVEACAELLQQGAQINEKNIVGSTALHLAVKNNHDIVIFLLRNGALCDIEDNNGYYAQDYSKDDKMYQLLFKYKNMLPIQQCAKHIEQSLGKTDLYERNIWRVIWPYI